MLKLLLRIFLYALLFVAIITFGPSGLFLDFQPQSIDIPFPKSFTGPLESNNILSSAQKLFVNQIEGPESIAIYNGILFTGSSDGYIYKIYGNNLKKVVKIIKEECPDEWNRTSCGRPLGLKFDSKGVLYVVEASHGIYTVEDVLTKAPKVKQIFDIKDTKVLGKPSLFIDDIAIDENGSENGGNILYISDSTTKYDFSNIMLALVDANTGRLIRYNTVTKKLETIFSGLLFPNGVEITDDKTSVLVTDTNFRKIFKHYIRGANAGQTIVLISELPGEPDNIRRSATKRETYLITSLMARNASNQLIFDTLNRHPYLKIFIYRFAYLIGTVIELIGNTFGNIALSELGFGLKSGYMLVMASFRNAYGMVLEIDANGNILQSFHSPDGSITTISEAREVKISDTESVLYLGSFANKYIGKLVLNKRN